MDNGNVWVSGNQGYATDLAPNASLRLYRVVAFWATEDEAFALRPGGQFQPPWERWLVGSKPRDDRHLAGVFRDEAVIHPVAAGTAALPGEQPSGGGSLSFQAIDRSRIAIQFLLPNRASAINVCAVGQPFVPAKATLKTKDA